MNTKDHAILNHGGAETVQATEPVPGLFVYRVPAHVMPDSRIRWTLGVSTGLAMASFEDGSSATKAAEAIAGLADWTATTDQLKATILRNGELRRRWWDTIQAHGGLHPSEAAEMKRPRPITEADIRAVAERYEGDDTDGVAIIGAMAIEEPFMHLDTERFNEAFDQVMRLVHPEHYTT